MTRHPLRIFTLFAVLVVAGAHDAFAAPPAPVTIILVRHAERVSNDGDLPLSEAGRERAALLARMLGHSGITHVFTSEMIRTRETAAPLAAHRGLSPVTVPVAQADLLVTRLNELPPGAVALVVNHGGPIPRIIEKLGATAPAAIGENEFDRLFVVTRLADRASVVELRYGKSPEAAAPAH